MDRVNTGLGEMNSEGKSRSRGPTTADLGSLADQTLSFFKKTADAARSEMHESAPGPASLAAVNTFTGTKTLDKLSDIGTEKRRRLAILSSEPAIARIVVMEDGKPIVYYIARATPDSGQEPNIRVANYRASLGRLASLPVGAKYAKPTPKGEQLLEILEKTLLQPSLDPEGWDSKNSKFEHIGHFPKTIVSLRHLLPRAASMEMDLLDELLAEAKEAENVVEGFRRSVLAKMGLREAGALDEFQDEIFRLPLSTRLLILGPPGTGKTTTLIKRLGLKLDVTHLTDTEKSVISRTAAGMAGLGNSWLMFAPTDLLAQYVKENFAREEVPASDLRIETWTSFRQDIARKKLGILRTAARRGGLVMKETVSSLQNATLKRQTAWYVDFEIWQNEAFWSDLGANAKLLLEAEAGELRTMGLRLEGLLKGADAKGPLSLADIMETAAELSKASLDLRQGSERRAREAFAKQLAKDRGLLTALADFVASLEDDAEEPDDAVVDDEEDRIVSQDTREAAFLAYVETVGALARAHVSGRKVAPRSRTGKILAWLGGRIPSESELSILGRALRASSAVTRLSNPLRRYMVGIPQRYRQFRRQRQAEGKWYSASGFVGSEAHPLEIDVILLARLRSTATLLADRRFAASIADASYASLKNVADLYRTQIAVDEATDFSPIQLACMAALGDPAARSFTACGDFHQRITAWGSRSLEDLVLLDGLDVRGINITYRHSRQLNEFAHKLISSEYRDSAPPSLPEHVDNEGVPPALGIGLRTDADIAAWIVRRIEEIENISGGIPSVAVLVDVEDRVSPLAKSLDTLLSQRNLNLNAVACQGGLAIGRDNQVRVFDVQHIKGLEFEAVFFVGLDRLAKREPDIFAKYLYVGATRAALFLGLTIEDRLPPILADMRSTFVEGWTTAAGSTRQNARGKS